MFFVDQHEASFAPKCLFIGMMAAALIVSGWMMFPLAGTVPEWFEPYLLEGDPHRRGLVFFCLAVYALRVTITTVVFLKRKFIWIEAVIVTAVMTFVVLAFAREGGANPQPPGLLEITGLALYACGSFLNTGSEFQRHRFKSDPANEGRLYTGGLFRFAMNVNYFGDIVLFSGLAMVSGRLTLLVIPLIMALNFVFFIIPRKEAYLTGKYGARFNDVSGRTRKLIPFIY